MNLTARRAWGALAAIAAAIVLVSWWNASRTDDTTPQAAAPATPAPPTIPPQSAQAAAEVGAPAPSPGTMAGVDPVIAQSREASALIATAGRDRLQARHASESTDPRWAPAKEQALLRLSTSPQAQELGANPLNFSASCRTTVCLLNADFASRRAAEDWFTLFTLDAIAEMPQVSVQRLDNPDGSVRLELYGFARPPKP